MTQRHAVANGHSLTEFEVRNILFGLSRNRLLTGDFAQFVERRFDNLLIGDSLAEALVDHDLLEHGNLHYAAVTKFLYKRRHHLLLVHFF